MSPICPETVVGPGHGGTSAVRSPDRSVPGLEPNERWYYVKTDAPSTWLKVVVAYAEERGHIVTAHARRSMP